MICAIIHKDDFAFSLKAKSPTQIVLVNAVINQECSNWEHVSHYNHDNELL